MGQPGMLKTCHQLCWSERGELKHLSTPRKRKKLSIPLVVAIERGIAQTGVVTAMSGLYDLSIVIIT